MGLMAFMETMGTSSVPLLAAFFIGLMTAVSPCPLATNITAVAYAAKHVASPKRTLLVASLYTFGRMATYVTLAALIVWAGVNVQGISFFLQRYGDYILGPLLILIGLVMLEWLRLPSIKGVGTQKLAARFATGGLLGAFFLGALFALAFCPFSAVLFFGMLLPLAIAGHDPIIIPAVFSIGTGLPVIILSIVLVYSAGKIGAIMNKIKAIELWSRRIVGAIFIIVGIYSVVRLLV